MSNKETERQKYFTLAKELKAENSNREGQRVVITGKGGVGKTTLTAMLARLWAADHFQVLAVDEDPQQNLAFSLGFPIEKADEIIPVSKNLDYIEEKTGARPGEGWGVMLNLNPDVTDVVQRFGMKIDPNIDLLIIGSVIQAATGCLCPENTLLGAIVRFINLREDEVILMDTQAGVEHFGRALAEGFQSAIVVAEPSFNSLQVARHSAELAQQLGINHIYLAVNKVRTIEDQEKVTKFVGDKDIFESIHYLPFDDNVYKNEPDVSPLLELNSPYVEAVRALYLKLWESEEDRAVNL